MKNAEGKTLYPRKIALQTAEGLLKLLKPVTTHMEIVGSVRRNRKLVKDVEILFVPRITDSKEDMFQETPIDLVDELLNKLYKDGILEQRYNANGSPTWGKQNKLALHVRSGLPVDFFATTKLNWFNSLVVRTGGKETNLLISKTALAKGWAFEAYGAGYHRTDDKLVRHDCDSERDVFEFIGLEYWSPEERK